MARVVKVDLVLENIRYVRGAREAARATDTVSDSVDDLGKAGVKASRETDHLGGELSELARDAHRLDRQIDDTKDGIRELARQIAATSDVAERAQLSKKLNVERRTQRQQISLRNLIDLPDVGKVGAEAATTFGDVFGKNLPRVLARIPAGTGGVLGGIIAVPLVATLGAAVSAGILGGVAGGGIVGGIALASKDSRVQAAGSALAATVMGDLEASATRFVSPTIHGIGIIRSAWADVADEVDGVFAATSRYVEPLARGVAGAVREIGPGLREAAEAAGPVIRELSAGLPRIGSALGDLLSTAADHADDAASAVRLIVMGIEAGINFTASLVDGLGDLYEGLVKAGSASADFAASYTGWIPIVGDKLADNRDRMRELKDALDEGGGAGENAGMKIWGGLDKVDTAASAAAVEVETLTEAIRRMAGENISAEEANIRLEEAIDRATEAGRKNNDGIDRGTEKGRANRQLLIGLAEASNQAAAAIMTQTGSQGLASEATERGRAKFLAAADAMGVEKAEALRLANQLFGIPTKVDTKIMVTANTQPALDNARGVVARINSMNARIRVTAEPSGGFGGSAHTGHGYSTGQRWGGIYERAQDGLLNLRQAGVYSPQGPARYAFAEPATGGEAFVPRNGDPRRSLAILDQAAGWYGAGLRPRHMSAGAAAPAAGGMTVVNRTLSVTVNVPATVNKADVGREVVEAVQAYERSSGKGWRG